MGKQYVDAPLLTDSESDLSFRQKTRLGFVEYASAISLLQDDIYKEILSVRKSIINPSSTLAGLVTLSPATATRNVILPTAVDATNLVLKAIASQTAKALEIQSSAGVVVGSITVAGVIAAMTWQGVSISTTYTDAKIKTVTGTANRLTIGGTSTDPTFDISTAYVGQTTITTLGTIGTGVWNGTAIGIGYGGTGLGSVGATNQLFGTNAGATGYEHKTGTLSAAGALGNLTTLDMSGAATIGGNIYSASGSGVYNNVVDQNRVVGYSTTTLEFGADANWTNANYRIQSGTHTFKVGTANRLLIADLLATIVPAASFSSTLITASQAAIGGALVAGNGLTVTGSLMTGTSQNGLVVDVTTTNAATGTARGGYFKISTAASAFVNADMNVVEAAEPTVGAGSSITNLRYFYANTTAAVATNKYALFIEAVAGGVTINRAIHTAGAGDVLFSYLAGTGTRFVNVTSTGVLGATTSTFPATAVTGDILYASATDTWSRLALGGALSVFGVNAGGTNVEWAGVTGTGSVMRAISPTTTGTLTAAIANFSGAVTASGIIKSTATGGGTSSGLQVVSTASACLLLRATDAAADNEMFDIVGGGTTLKIRAINDAESIATIAIQINRSDASITGIDLNGPTSITGAVTATGTIRSSSTYGFVIGELVNVRRIMYGANEATSYTLATDAGGFAGLYASLGVFSSTLGVTGVLTASSTTDATAVGTGSIVCAGGISVAKRIILDGGTGKTIRYANATANAAVATTLGSVGPTGSTAGDPQGWIRVDIAGTDRYVPFW